MRRITGGMRERAPSTPVWSAHWQPLTDKELAMRCPNCQAEVLPEMEYCGVCGTALAAQAVAPASDHATISAPHVSQPATLATPSAPLLLGTGEDTLSEDSPEDGAPPAQSGIPSFTQSVTQALMPGVFGVNPEPSAIPPSTALQTALRRTVSDGLAANLWFTSALGAVVAVVVGLLLTAVVGVLWGNLLTGALAALAPVSSVSEVLRSAAGAFQRPDVLKLFAIEHHVPLSIQFAAGAPGSGAHANGTLALPLMGLLLVPAIALTLGGAIAATSDYTRVARFSIARGALIAPFYAILLFILALMGSSSITGGMLGIGGTARLGPAPLSALFAGLLWGVIFGGLGGWIHLSGRDWLAGALPMLRAARNPLPGAALAGALVALVCGVLLFMALGFAALALANVQSAGSVGAASLSTATARNGALGGLSGALEVMFIVGPAGAIWAFALATGAALGSDQVTSGANQHTTLGFLGAQHTPMPHLWLLVALVPLICYLTGGRVAARIAGAGTTSAAAKAGALMALPLSLLMALLAGATSTSLALSGEGIRASEGAGPSVGGTFLATLLLGAVVGGLGGMSLVAMPRLGEAPRRLLAPVRPLGRPLFAQLDQLTSRASGEPLTAARAWFYDGMLVTAILGVVTLGAELVTVVAARAVPLDLATGVDKWLAAALVGLPLAFFVGALVTAFTAPPLVPAFSSPPMAAIQPATMPPAPATPVANPVSIPDVLSSATPLGAQPMALPITPPTAAMPPAEPHEPSSGGTPVE